MYSLLIRNYICRLEAICDYRTIYKKFRRTVEPSSCLEVSSPLIYIILLHSHEGNVRMEWLLGILRTRTRFYPQDVRSMDTIEDWNYVPFVWPLIIWVTFQPKLQKTRLSKKARLYWCSWGFFGSSTLSVNYDYDQFQWTCNSFWLHGSSWTGICWWTMMSPEASNG